MKIISGRPKFDSIYIGEVKLETILYPQVHMTVIAGYQDSKTNQRFGSLSLSGGWRPETLAKLGEFMEALELDVASMVFEDVSIPSGSAQATPTSSGIPEL